LLHWESQSNTALDSPTGQNLVHHLTRAYTILVFARPRKKHNNCTVPFVFLGPARHVSHQKDCLSGVLKPEATADEQKH
jgi:hypothetical protein